MSLTPGKRPSLADKLRAQEKDAKQEGRENIVVRAIKKATVRAKKKN